MYMGTGNNSTQGEPGNEAKSLDGTILGINY